LGTSDYSGCGKKASRARDTAQTQRQLRFARSTKLKITKVLLASPGKTI
jgi:hypothetical protein